MDVGECGSRTSQCRRTPSFTGQAANLAMFDVAELAKQILAETIHIDRALKVYESELFPRSAEIAAHVPRPSGPGVDALA